jgi:hypothetical protein
MQANAINFIESNIENLHGEKALETQKEALKKEIDGLKNGKLAAIGKKILETNELD